MRTLFLGIFFILSVSPGIFAQNAEADFNLPPHVCQGQFFQLDNTSINADSFEWDFCLEDFNDNLEVNYIADIVGGGRNLGIDFIEVGGTWYGIATSWNRNSLYRLTFSNGLSSAPTGVEALSNPDNVLNQPASIALLEQGGIVYAVVQNWTSTLVKIAFNDGIAGSDQSGSVVHSSFGGNRSKLELVNTPSELIAVVVNSNTTISLLDFDNDINDPVEASDVLITSAIGGVFSTQDIEMIEVNDQWYGFVSSFSTGRIHRVDFGSDIMTGVENIQLNVTSNLYNSDRVSNIELTEYGSGFALHVLNFSGELFRVNLGTDITNSNITSGEVRYGEGNAYPQGFSLKFLKYQGDWLGFVINDLTTQLYNITNQTPCAASVALSNEREPVVQFNTDGMYPMTLIAYGTNGSSSSKTQIVTVTTNTAPPISYTSQNICQSSPVQFTSESTSSGLTYTWDFGDTNTSMDANPSHTYLSAGDYDVSLIVSDGTCNNFTQQTITIYNEPVSTFTLPSGVICTNQSVFIENTTTGDFGGNETWQWQIDGLTVSADRDFDGSFATGGPAEVKLIASIPGCSNEAIQNINVEPGPVPSFAVDDACQGILMNFTNSSTGDISSFLWDFDNGFTSDLENPSLEYSSAGSYNVSLTVESTLGCVTTTENLVTVYANPQVQFSNELSCSQSTTQFNDLSTVDGANLVGWFWDFDDPNAGSNTSTDQNATHVFSGSGNFDVKLVATSVFGCMDSLTQVVSVLPAPEADFSFDKLCINEPVNFEDTSVPVSGEGIISWAWDIAGEFSSEQNPSATFDIPLDYDITLFVTSENLCVGSVTKTIDIAQAADMDFGTEFECNNQPVRFYDLSETNSDSAIAWSWDFASLGQAADSATFFDFGEVGEYMVDLAIQTANGCEYSFQKAVLINPAPSASFLPSPSFGAPPLQVSFTNGSAGATAYQWTFEEGATSTDTNAVHTYTELGEFDAELIAISDALCRDTVSQQILVVLPDLEVELNGLFVVEEQQQSLVLSLTNNGTLRVEEMDAFIDLGGNVTIRETINKTINPEEMINHTLDLTLTDNQLSYVCVEVVPVLEGIEDSNPLNNAKCENLSPNDLVISDPYPNPATNMIMLNVVTEQERPLNIRLLNSTGSFTKIYDLSLNTGFNEILLNTDNLEQGIYFLQIPEVDRVEKIFISR